MNISNDENKWRLIMDIKTEVVVIGGGPSGACAAIAAARLGSDVVLIEKAGFCGGMATLASVPAFPQYTDGSKNIAKGLALEIRDKMVETNKTLKVKDGAWQPIDPEVLKTVYDNLLKEAGVRVLYHTTLIGVTEENGSVQSIQIESLGGAHELFGEYFIDCTGNAELVAKTECKTYYGDQNNQVQAPTLCFRLGNVDTDKYQTYLEHSGDNGNLTMAVSRAKEQDDFDITEHHVCGAIIQSDGVVGMNFGHEYEVNPLDPVAISLAEMEARAKLPKLVTFMRNYVPGFENAALISSGPSIGLRETRRIIGHYLLNEEDYYLRNIPEDVIGVSAYPIDIHSSSFAQNTEHNHKEYYTSRYGIGEYYGIPYRCLIPKELVNVGVAGRAISADRKTHGSVRLMNTCQITGQAVGTAASLLVGSGKSMIDVSIEVLQETIRDNDGFIPEIKVS